MRQLGSPWSIPKGIGWAMLALVVMAVPAKSAPIRLASDLRFIQDVGAGFFSVRPADLLASELTENLPPLGARELQKNLGEMEEHLGIAPKDVERMSMMVFDFRNEPVGVIRTAKAYDVDKIKGIVVPGSIAVGHRGKTIYSKPGRRHHVAFCPMDRHVFLVGPVDSIRTALDRAAKESESNLDDAIAMAVRGHHIVLGGQPMLALFPMWGFSASSHDHSAPAVKEAVPANVPLPPRNRLNPQPVPVPPPPPPPPLPPGTDQADPFQIAFQPEVVIQPEARPDHDHGEHDHEHRHGPPSMEQMLAELPPSMLPFKPLFQAKSIAIGITLNAKTEVEWKLSFTSETRAQDGEVATRTLLYVMRELIPWWSKNVLDRAPNESPQLFAFLTQVQTALRTAPVKRDEKVVSGRILLQVKPAALTAAFAELEKRAARTVSSNNLKQIGIAVHNYHDTYGAFPGAAILDKKGKPLLSWRVAILPFIEEEALFRQFKLDEPWHSPHNKKLLAKMPKVFAPPVGKTKIPHATYYRVFAGPRTPFDPKRTRVGFPTLGSGMRFIHDGTSNTILTVEAAEAVPWTKPEPLVFDPNKPLPKLGGIFPGGFHVGMCDGSTRFIKNTIDGKNLSRLIDGQDGQVVQWERVTGQRPGFRPNIREEAVDDAPANPDPDPVPETSPDPDPVPLPPKR